MGDKTASPSPAVSSAKTRRLDALLRRLGGKRAGAAQHPGKTNSICVGAPAAEHHAFPCGECCLRKRCVHHVGDVRHLLAGSPSAVHPNKRHKASSAVATPPPGKQKPANFPYDLVDHVRFDATLARRLQVYMHCAFLQT